MALMAERRPVGSYASTAGFCGSIYNNTLVSQEILHANDMFGLAAPHKGAGHPSIDKVDNAPRTLLPGEPSALAGSGEGGSSTRLKSGVQEKTSRGFRLLWFLGGGGGC